MALRGIALPNGLPPTLTPLHFDFLCLLPSLLFSLPFSLPPALTPRRSSLRSLVPSLLKSHAGPSLFFTFHLSPLRSISPHYGPPLFLTLHLSLSFTYVRGRAALCATVQPSFASSPSHILSISHSSRVHAPPHHAPPPWTASCLLTMVCIVLPFLKDGSVRDSLLMHQSIVRGSVRDSLLKDGSVRDSLLTMPHSRLSPHHALTPSGFLSSQGERGQRVDEALTASS